MQQRSRYRYPLLLASLLLAGSALAQQKYRLRDVVAQGDRAAVESNFDMGLTIRTTAGGQEGPEFTFSNKETEQYTEEILGVKDGEPTAARRVYTVAGELETDSSGEKKVTVSSLQGKTVTIRRKGDGVDVAAAEGALDEKAMKELKTALDHNGRYFFPDREVAPGDEWSVDEKTATRIFDGAEKVTLTGKLLELTEYQGHKAARVGIVMEAVLKQEDGPGPILMTLKGDLYHALELDRMLSLDLSGPVVMKGEVEQDGVKVQLDGQGTARMRITQKWEKVAGKPVK